MTGPVWLGTVLGGVALLAGAAALARLAFAWRVHRPTDAEVDVHNLLMGVSMAGVLIPKLLIVTGGGVTTAWLVVWIVVTVWFAVSVARDATRGGSGRRFAGHHVPHLVMSAAMVYMFSVGDGPLPGGGLLAAASLAYAFLVFMVGYAVVVVDRLPVIAVAGIGDPRLLGRAMPTASGAARAPVAPRLAAATNVVMALVMGYMLVLLFG